MYFVIGTIVALLVITIPLIGLARRFDVSYPIVLVLGGLILGFVPGLPAIQMNPDVVFLVFLPPMLFWGALTAPTDKMREDAGEIGLLAFGLVIATTVAVAAVAHAIVPGLPWAVAFVLGAIVSPTDELAAIPVLERFRLPPHLTAIIEGEGLLNDATALVIYASAVAIVERGTFQPYGAAFQFILTVAGSILIGIIAGRIAVLLWQRITDEQLQGVISVILPFMAYLPAQALGLSGVLAVVTVGIYASRFTPRVVTPAARTQAVGFWNLLVFLLNAVLYLVLGLQLHRVALDAFAHASWQVVLLYSAAVNIVLIAIRIPLVLLAEYAPTAAPPERAQPNWKNAFIVAWSGLRGAVSLAAALAIPTFLPNGSAFPYRDLIIFITFSTIAVTLIGGGLTLPFVVERLNITRSNEDAEEMLAGRRRLADAASARIDELDADGRLDAAHAAALRKRYEHFRDLSQTSGTSGAAHRLAHADVEREIIDAQRDALIRMHEDGDLDNVALRRLQADLDTATTRNTFNYARG
jgi:CPA1 family monovalent cation:H+ antiporter